MVEEVTLADVYNQFSLDTYNKVGYGISDNLFMSTFSILSALSMCLVGARNNTEKQLKQITGFYRVSNDDIYRANEIAQQYVDSLNKNMTLSVANKVFPKQGFSLKQDYIDTLKRYFFVDLEPLDFGNSEKAAGIINDWVKDKTKNKIKDLIEPSSLNGLTRLILVNAIYFKANWLQKFIPENTHKDTFYLSDGSTKEVDMMKMVGKKFNFKKGFEGLDADYCEFPYVGDQLAMTIILPHEGVHISKVEAQLNAHTLKSVIQENDIKLNVNVLIPKFKLESSVELSSKLAEMGAPDAFDAEKADFSGISDTTGLYISKVVHKSFIEVNEEGSEAAAATAVEFMVKSAVIGFKTPEFKVNRPFIFLIHNRYLTFFIGKYVKP